MSAGRDFLDLVSRLESADLNRSENDLSSNLKNALVEYGLHGVVDTGSGSNRVKRPDIALYTDRSAADLALAAEVVIEAKKPTEVAAFSSLSHALIDDVLWTEKFLPYARAHSERVQFFVLTTFERFFVVPISEALRRDLTGPLESASAVERRALLSDAMEFDLRDEGGQRWLTWVSSNLTCQALAPPPLSSILNLNPLNGPDDLEVFAGTLADVIVGPEAAPTSISTLLSTVRLTATTLDELDPAARSALIVYTMSVHGGMSVTEATSFLGANFDAELAAFFSASVHSLVGRLFAMKTIEDAFCVGVEPPLIPQANWVFHSDRFDGQTRDELPSVFFAALEDLGNVANPAIADLATTNRFYDWLASEVDPTAFRRLIDLFYSHDFSELDGDLLGRFFELYAQRVDRRKRRELGQYYTPMPIVRYMWRVAMEVIQREHPNRELVVLDPAVGSGTFLIEGARQLHGAGQPRFWESLNGFDIAPQVIGVAQVNLYLTVLGLLNRASAEAVGTLHLYPTDALDPRNGAHLHGLLQLLTDPAVHDFLQRRIELSEQVKRRSRFPLVIGNPPYKHNSNRTLVQMAEHFPALLRSSRANARAQENTIREDYAWFFAAADHYLIDRGVIAFVVSDSFCYGPSFRHFREDLLRRYRILQLLHLGRFVFRDVGPRTSFVIIIMERRSHDLPDAEQVGPIPYIDARPLAEGVAQGELGTEADPRLLALDASSLPNPVEHRPDRSRGFRFFPAGAAVSTVHRAPVSAAVTPRRVFAKKWPGAVSGFDLLFKAKDRSAVEARLQELFRIASAASPSTALDQLAQSIRASEHDRSKLRILVEQIRTERISFDTGRIRRALTGSAPRECAWYPDERMSSWIYYEPRFTFARAVYEDRAEGWGTSNQWREDASHGVAPKLAFTTTTNPDAGLKAFVLNEPWIVLKGAGTRQQLNYTAVENPLRSQQLDGPNNLGDEALALHQALVRLGHSDEDFLLYVAAIYNSALADDYLRQGGENTMRIPVDPATLDLEIVTDLIGLARRARDLSALKAKFGEQSTLDESDALALATAEDLEGFGLVQASGSGGRFAQLPTWSADDDSMQAISEAVVGLCGEMDELVTAIFEDLPSAR
jgi:hypothetical protein